MSDFTKKINAFAKGAIRKNISVLNWALSKFSKNPYEILMTEACRALDNSDYLVSFRIRPIDPFKVPILKRDFNYNNIAIVMQGPIRHEDDFTIKAVQYYKRLYKDCLIVVSTWDDEKKESIKAIESEGAIIVLNAKPNNPGQLNVNLQLITSKAGIDKAFELGAKYICKSRTDQLVSKPFIFEYLINLMDVFPVTSEITQNKRIVVLSMHYGNMFHPFLISDFFYFGVAEDMVNLFSIPLDKRTSFSMKENATKREYAEKLYAPEVYIIKSYLDKLGMNYKFTVKDYWDCLIKFFLCIDRKTIDLFWPKYDRKYAEHSYYGDYFIQDDEYSLMTMNFDYVNWVNLYCGSLKYSPEFEHYADIPFGF